MSDTAATPAAAPDPVTPPAGTVIVVCARPGFRRAGLVHPAYAEHPPGSLTDEQIAALLAEPMLAVTIVPAAGKAKK